MGSIKSPNPRLRNNRADSTRHAHAIQGPSYPEHPWQQLREQHPGVYETAIPASIDPVAWVHVRLEMRDGAARVYLDNGAEPVLSVTLLGPAKSGGIGLWVGDKSDGEFANLSVRP